LLVILVTKAAVLGDGTKSEKGEVSGIGKEYTKISNQIAPPNMGQMPLWLEKFNANVRINDTDVNIGQVGRLGWAVGKGISTMSKNNKIKKARSKSINPVEKNTSVDNRKVSVSKKTEQQKINKIASNMETNKTVKKVASMNRKDYLTKGIKPSYKK